MYYFTIGNASRGFSPEASFETIPLENAPLVFIEGGDWDITPEASLLAAKAGELRPHALLLGGDYPSTENLLDDYRRWDTWLDTYSQYLKTPEGRLIPLVMALGNHEVPGGFDCPREYVPFFFHLFPQGNEGKSYFSLSFGKRVQLLVLDSGHVASHSGEQRDWLERELQKHLHTPIRMALYHVPLFPSIRFIERNALYSSFYKLVKICKGKHAASCLLSPKSLEGRRHWLPLFDKYGLTVAFEHHDQTLKRTKLLRYGKEDPQGTLYLGDGGWGPKVQFHPIQGFFHSYFARLKGLIHFFWIVQIEEHRIVYSAMTASGTIIDYFVQNI